MINRKIENLAYAIKIAEGWLPEKQSVTYSNHNPGALRSSPLAIGKRGGFAYFLNDQVGFLALCWDLAKKCRGETVTELNGESTVEKLIKIYTAETNEEKLENYLRIVELVTRKNRQTLLKYFL